MPKNNLYNAINTIYITKKVPLTGASLSPRTYATGNKFFLFDLPTTERPISIADCTLSNHHLTVHADPIGALDLKSQYHYTASFVNKAGQEYRLHVYFNAEDNYVCEPQLSRVLPGGDVESVDCQEHHQAFLWLAHSACKDVVKQIRQRQNQLVTVLQRRYDEEERLATSLSTDLVTNKELYLSGIDRQLKTLEQIRNYSNNTHLTKGLISYLKKVKIVIAKPLPIVGKSTSSTEESTDGKRESKTKAKIESKQTKTSKHSVFFKKPALSSKTIVLHGISIMKKTGLAQIIFDLNVELEQIKRMTGDHLINSTTDFFNKLVALDVDLEIGIYDASMGDIVAFHQLQKNINKQGKRVLEQLLANEQYDAATRLAPFYHLIEKTPYFLNVNDPELFNFLLKAKIFPVDYKNFTLFGTAYNSVADYYFNTPMVNASTINCFDTFVKNGLSLMEIDRNTGLPFAAILLLQPKHPLRIVLERNADLTLHNPMFYRQLNGILKVLIALPDCPEPRRKQIAELIENNQISVNSLRGRTISSTKLISAATDFGKQFLAEYGEEQIAKLNSDPEVITLKRVLEERSVAYLSALSRIERHKSVSVATNLIESLNEFWKNLEVKPSFSFEDFKKATIQFCLDQLKTLDLNSELIDIKTQLKGYVSYKGKLTATQRHLINRQAEILSSLQTLQKSYAVEGKSTRCLVNSNDTKSIKLISAMKDHSTELVEHLTTVIDSLTMMDQQIKLVEDLISNIDKGHEDKKSASDKLTMMEQQMKLAVDLISNVFKGHEDKKSASIGFVP